jgi:ribosomal protein L11 methyltransferase
VPHAAAEELRASFLELAPEGFEEVDRNGEIELAAYGPAAGRVLAEFPAATVSEVADGWEDGWRAFHHPVRIGPLWVGPPWETPPAAALAVVIDPGRAFGTGAHATTRLCLELLLERPRGSLLDVGCGSGVLAIAAARLGFDPVLAIDVDPVAVAVTRKNAEANGVRIEAREADASAGLQPAGLVVANIALAAVEALAPPLDAGGVIASGYLAADRPELRGLARTARRELDGWAADLFERP